MHRLPSIKYRDGEGGEKSREIHLSFICQVHYKNKNKKTQKMKKRKKEKKIRKEGRKRKTPRKPLKQNKTYFFLKIVAQNNKTHSQATCWHCVPE